MTIIKEKIMPRIIFITAPAIMTIIRFQTFALLNERGSGLSSSSPSIAQNPPIGKSLKEYCVSPFLKLKSFGPIPSANSFTLMPESFAVMKCPNSCNPIISSKSSTAITTKAIVTNICIFGQSTPDKNSAKSNYLFTVLRTNSLASASAFRTSSTFF